ncbi:hypothetical protein F8M41_015094 [Gigaspora margarita]|uniref:Uncharacterized protein n=1 Tax=Gigaspora margarita TaxID=4874 RepID=A0A8H4ENP4_GIGMA|nr:hypothetical protein F8M41_015094 [Gigaspora margarita]
MSQSTNQTFGVQQQNNNRQLQGQQNTGNLQGPQNAGNLQGPQNTGNLQGLQNTIEGSSPFDQAQGVEISPQNTQLSRDLFSGFSFT